VGGAFCAVLRPLGVLLRPLADTVVVMPPLAIREEVLRKMCGILVDSLAVVPHIVRDKRRQFADD
jgi:adenosylmethionine-8-amino-7-oxononanoate aminotransferase